MTDASVARIALDQLPSTLPKRSRAAMPTLAISTVSSSTDVDWWVQHWVGQWHCDDLRARRGATTNNRWPHIKAVRRDRPSVRRDGQPGHALNERIIPAAIAKDTTYKIVIPIEGVERIAVRVAAIPTRDQGSLDIYLGVNSI